MRPRSKDTQIHCKEVYQNSMSIRLYSVLEARSMAGTISKQSDNMSRIGASTPSHHLRLMAVDQHQDIANLNKVINNLNPNPQATGIMMVTTEQRKRECVKCL